MSTVISICLAMLGVSLLLAFVRLVRGPSLPDRVVALDLIAVISVAIVIVLDIQSNIIVFLDAGIVVALVGFVGSIAFARYLERRVL